MKINKTTAGVISSTLDHLHGAYAHEGGIKGYVYGNFDSVVETLQLIADFDLEGMIDVALFTRWLGSDDDAFDAFLTEFKSFVFDTTGYAFHHTNGDVVASLHFILNQGTDDNDDDDEEGSDLIDDEVYGDVDPEDISFLNQCLKVG
jgi:hypothetical protein